jgi:threonine/homoserine/homoserine lactone efflux protein
VIPVESLITFIIASIFLIASPGPDNIFVITQSAIHGSRTGILVTLGLVSGLIFHTSAVAFGVAAIIKTSPFAFMALKTVGALYLLFLAWQAFTAHKTKLKTDQQVPHSALKLYRRGIIMNVTNPKVTIFFLAFLPQFVSADNGPVIGQVFMLGGVFMVLGLSIFVVFALLASKLGKWLNQSDKAQLILNRLAGTVFVTLALNLLFSNK